MLFIPGSPSLVIKASKPKLHKDCKQHPGSCCKDGKRKKIKAFRKSFETALAKGWGAANKS